MADATGSLWGWLISHQTLPNQSADLVGASLDIVVHGTNLVEMELLSGMATSYSNALRKLLFLYFAVPLNAPKGAVDEVVGAIRGVFTATREGLEHEKGKMEIHNNAPGTGPALNGYVERNRLTGTMGPIHLNLEKIMAADLRSGGIYWSGLILHEATHRFVKTTDLIGEVKVRPDTSDGYLAGDRRNTLAKFEEFLKQGNDPPNARQKVVGKKGNYITTTQHLENADSFTWLYLSMLQGRTNGTLSTAIRFSGLHHSMQRCCEKFGQAQRAAINVEELAVDGMVTIDQF